MRVAGVGVGLPVGAGGGGWVRGARPGVLAGPGADSGPPGTQSTEAHEAAQHGLDLVKLVKQRLVKVRRPLASLSLLWELWPGP